MNFASLLGISVISMMITLFEWPRKTNNNNNQKKEKWSLLALTTIGWLLAILLVYIPDLPGPSQLIDFIFKPLSRFIK